MMTTTKRQLLAAAVILTVCCVQYFNDQLNVWLQIKGENVNFYWRIAGQILKYLIPAVLVIAAFHKPNKIMTELGLSHGFLEGIQYAFLFTLPMLIGYALMGEYNNEFSLLENILKAFKDGFREEVYFRAFLFGQLFRHVKLGFLPAVVINGLIFGFLHLWQAHTLSESIGVVAITFAGAVWFAWLFVEWKGNLWLPIFMHFFMNFYWHLFSTEHSAVGGFMLNLPRILTIALSIYWTIKIIRKNGNLIINRKNLILNP
ncbi:MAG: hypothetical protein RL757_2561 [Bacteroidota bacterium]